MKYDEVMETRLKSCLPYYIVDRLLLLLLLLLVLQFFTMYVLGCVPVTVGGSSQCIGDCYWQVGHHNV